MPGYLRGYFTVNSGKSLLTRGCHKLSREKKVETK